MDSRYPIGEFRVNENITKDDVQHWINDIEAAPNHLFEAVKGLTDHESGIEIKIKKRLLVGSLFKI
ncbi:hypothetical protein [Bacillus sp. V5-8f]|uniref:hypothetical protein n=1 Tax=Bacillus sp. V5-8f TaxID=2053044 RepID=UPI000C77029E|nr:hypothetical protein [Bacillus sp. V5-8f]PLT33144.1 hypothetical protein CUU64_15295 [Bacillus sp. V5-8f]